MLLLLMPWVSSVASCAADWAAVECAGGTVWLLLDVLADDGGLSPNGLDTEGFAGSNAVGLVVGSGYARGCAAGGGCPNGDGITRA